MRQFLTRTEARASIFLLAAMLLAAMPLQAAETLRYVILVDGGKQAGHQAAEIAELAGLTLTDDATYAAIDANTPQWSDIEELLEYILATYPPPTRYTVTYDDPDEPPPF